MTRERRAALEARIIANRKRRNEPAPFVTQAFGAGPLRQAHAAPRPHVHKTPVEAYPTPRKARS